MNTPYIMVRNYTKFEEHTKLSTNYDEGEVPQLEKAFINY